MCPANNIDMSRDLINALHQVSLHQNLILFGARLSPRRPIPHPRVVQPQILLRSRQLDRAVNSGRLAVYERYRAGKVKRLLSPVRVSVLGRRTQVGGCREGGRAALDADVVGAGFEVDVEPTRHTADGTYHRVGVHVEVERSHVRPFLDAQTPRVLYSTSGHVELLDRDRVAQDLLRSQFAPVTAQQVVLPLLPLKVLLQNVHVHTVHRPRRVDELGPVAHGSRVLGRAELPFVLVLYGSDVHGCVRRQHESRAAFEESVPGADERVEHRLAQ
mmetsp:Transcript_48271/g.89511  ORF Transcript_48271/g.89511 Transcript_48271/m.89511 type:complete len:273 (-) Transcript_48271:911-1729(-)